jgi:hypothetical protein
VLPQPGGEDAHSNDRLFIVLGGGVQARPRPIPEKADFGRETEEHFYGTAEELHEQEMVERVLSVLWRAYQLQQPVGL